MDISLIVKAALIGGALIVAGIASVVFKMKNDNPVEQAAEAIIKEETGLELDLTPEDKDPKK